MKCDNCISKGEFGTCQNFRSLNYGKPVEGEEACELFEKGSEERN